MEVLHENIFVLFIKSIYSLIYCFQKTYLTTKLALFDAATKNAITLLFNILAHFLHFFRQVHVTQNAISIQYNRRNMLIVAYCSK